MFQRETKRKREPKAKTVLGSPDIDTYPSEATFAASASRSSCNGAVEASGRKAGRRGVRPSLWRTQTVGVPQVSLLFSPAESSNGCGGQNRFGIPFWKW